MHQVIVSGILVGRMTVLSSSWIENLKSHTISALQPGGYARNRGYLPPHLCLIRVTAVTPYLAVPPCRSCALSGAWVFSIRIHILKKKQFSLTNMAVCCKCSMISDNLLHAIKNVPRLQINVSHRILLVRWNCFYSGEIIYKVKETILFRLKYSHCQVPIPNVLGVDIEMCTVAC